MPISFQGGPLDGQGTMTDEEMTSMAPPMGAPPGMGSAPAAPPADEEPAGDEGAMFRSLLSSIRGLLAMNTLSEKNKLALEKASTLVQQIKAEEEKENEQAMTGTLSPGIMRRLGNGGGSGGGGY